VNAATSPLTALLWIFAVLAAILAALAVASLALYVRHRIRRRRGVYTRIFSETPQAISKTLTVSDLITDRPFRQQGSQGSSHPATETNVPARRGESPFHGSTELEKWSPNDSGTK
jgi:hypothetical protein